jgi:hypothetical protein
VRTKLVSATRPTTKQCSALVRTSAEDSRISRPLISVTITATTSHASRSDATTALLVIDAAAPSSDISE